MVDICKGLDIFTRYLGPRITAHALNQIAVYIKQMLGPVHTKRIHFDAFKPSGNTNTLRVFIEIIENASI